MKHSKNEKMLNVLIKDTVLPTQIIAFLFAVATITVGKKDKRRKGLNNEKKNSSVNDYQSVCFLHIIIKNCNVTHFNHCNDLIATE